LRENVALKTAVAAVGGGGGDREEEEEDEVKEEEGSSRENKKGVRDRIGGNSLAEVGEEQVLSFVRRTALAAYDLRESTHEEEGEREDRRQRGRRATAALSCYTWKWWQRGIAGRGGSRIVVFIGDA